MKKLLQQPSYKLWITYSIFILLLLITALISLSIGSSFISLEELWQHYISKTSNEHEFTLNVLRLPRVTLAILVGAALGVSGLILQSIIRNPLASPDIIGITAGGSVGAMIFLVFLVSAISIKWLPLAAIGGAAIVAILVYILSWKNGVTPIRLVLVGIGVAAAMNAMVTFMIVFSETAVTTKAYVWLTGSLYGTTMDDSQQMGIWLLIFLVISLLLAKTMEVLEFGDEIATGLGAKVQLMRFSLLFTSVGLAGSAVAFAGGIGFIGLIAPHIAKKVIPYRLVHLIPVSAMTGALMLMSADLIGRTIFMPSDIPAGVFTASIGAPFFIYLLYRNRH